jgi:hypothetical protein
MKTRSDSPTRGHGRSSGRSYAAEPDVLIEQLRKDEGIAEADTLQLTVPNQLGVAYNVHAIEAILTHLAPALGGADGSGTAYLTRLERCIHQGRQCRNCVGDTATRSPDFAPSEPRYGSGIEALELQQAHEAYETAQKIEDVNERRRQAGIPLRDMRYFASRVRTARVITNPTSTELFPLGAR